MRIIGNNETNQFNISPSVSISSNIPVAMPQRGWKVDSAISLGLPHPVPCATGKLYMLCCLYEAVLSKIPLQRLHLTAIDWCPPPDWTLLVFAWLQDHRQNDQISTWGGYKPIPENWQIVPDTDNKTSSLRYSYHDEHETDKLSGSSLEVWDNFSYGMALEDEFGILDQNIVYQFGTRINAVNYESLVLCYKCDCNALSCYHDHLQGHRRRCKRVFNDATKDNLNDQIRVLEVFTKQFPKIGRY